MSFRASIFALLLLLTGAVTAAAIQAPKLDKSFSKDGKVFISPGNDSRVAGVSIMGRANVLVSGDDEEAGPVLAQLDSAGNPRENFGRDGEVELRGLHNTIDSVATVDSHRRVIVAGADGFHVYVARLLPDGSPDDSFSGDGYASFDLRARTHVSAVRAGQSDKIVVVGSRVRSGKSDFFALGVKPTGKRDSGFGGGGTTFVRVNRPAAAVRPAATLDGNDFVIAGAGAGAIQLARIDAKGKVDRSVGKRGLATVRLSKQLRKQLAVTSVAMTDKGSFLLGGSYGKRGNGQPINGLLVRLRGSGELNRAFGHGGHVVVDHGRTGFVSGVAMRGNGRITAVGRVSKPGQNFANYWFADSYAVDGQPLRHGYERFGIESFAVGPFVVIDAGGQAVLAGSEPEDGEALRSAGFKIARLEN